MADQAEYGFHVTDPYDSFLGFGDVKVTSTFASDEPERKGVCLLIVHGVGSEAWRSDKEKPKFLLINLPFKTLSVKRLTLKKKTVLGIYTKNKAKAKRPPRSFSGTARSIAIRYWARTWSSFFQEAPLLGLRKPRRPAG